MNFLEFKEKLKDFVVFNLNDIRKVDNRFDLRRLNEWQKKGYIKMVRRGHYAFPVLKSMNLFFSWLQIKFIHLHMCRWKWRFLIIL